MLTVELLQSSKFDYIFLFLVGGDFSGLSLNADNESQIIICYKYINVITRVVIV